MINLLLNILLCLYICNVAYGVQLLCLATKFTKVFQLYSTLIVFIAEFI